MELDSVVAFTITVDILEGTHRFRKRGGSGKSDLKTLLENAASSRKVMDCLLQVLLRMTSSSH